MTKPNGKPKLPEATENELRFWMLQAIRVADKEANGWEQVYTFIDKLEAWIEQQGVPTYVVLLSLWPAMVQLGAELSAEAKDENV